MISFDIYSQNGRNAAIGILFIIVIIYGYFFFINKKSRIQVFLAFLGTFFNLCIPYAFNIVLNENYTRSLEAGFNSILVQAKLDIEDKNFESSNRNLHSLVANNPNNQSYKLTYAESLYKSNRIDEAEKQLIAISENDLTTNEVGSYHYYYGLVLKSKNTTEDYKKAIDFFSKVPENSDKYWKAQKNLGFMYSRINEYNKSKEIFEALIKSAGERKDIDIVDIVRYKTQLSRALIELNEYDKAKSVLKEAFNDKPDYYYLHFLLGKVYLKEGKYSIAMDSFKRAGYLKNDGDSYESYYNLAFCLDKLSYDEKNPSLHFKLGHAYLECGLYTEATHAYENAIHYDGNKNPEYPFYLGYSHLLNNNYAKASQFFSDALKKNPNNINYVKYEKLARCFLNKEKNSTSENWLELGIICSEIESYKHYAIKAFLKSIEIESKSNNNKNETDTLKTRYLLGKTYFELKEYKNALTEFEYVYEKYKNTVGEMSEKVRQDEFFSDLEFFRDAAFYEHALKNNSSHVLSFRLGEIYLENKHYEKAKEHFENAQQLNPDEPLYSKKLEEISRLQY